MIPVALPQKYCASCFISTWTKQILHDNYRIEKKLRMGTLGKKAPLVALLVMKYKPFTHWMMHSEGKKTFCDMSSELRREHIAHNIDWIQFSPTSLTSSPSLSLDAWVCIIIYVEQQWNHKPEQFKTLLLCLSYHFIQRLEHPHSNSIIVTVGSMITSPPSQTYPPC